MISKYLGGALCLVSTVLKGFFQPVHCMRMSLVISGLTAAFIDIAVDLDDSEAPPSSEGLARFALANCRLTRRVEDTNVRIRRGKFLAQDGDNLATSTNAKYVNVKTI